jgi:hypothetical protein
MKFDFWPFGIKVRIRNIHGFIVEKRIARNDVPVLDEELQALPPPAALTPEEVWREDKQAMLSSIGKLKARVAELESLAEAPLKLVRTIEDNHRARGVPVPGKEGDHNA